MTAHKEAPVPWTELLHRRERLPAAADLAEGFATLLQALGNVTPFELAVAGGGKGEALGQGSCIGLTGLIASRLTPTVDRVCSVGMRSNCRSEPAREGVLKNTTHLS
jgi:hypothetical protein